MQVHAVVAAAAASFVLVVVCLLLQPRGLRVQLGVCFFILSLVSTQLSLKALTQPPFDFRFPAWVTVCHFGVHSVVCTLYWAWMGDLSRCLVSSTGSVGRYAKSILPIAVSYPISCAFNNQSMLYVGAGLNAIVCTLTPIMTAVLSATMGRWICRPAWFGIFMAFCGAIIVSYAKFKRDDLESFGRGESLGIMLAFAAVVLRALKIVLQDVLLAPAAYGAAAGERAPLSGAGGARPEALVPMHVLALQAPPCFVVSVVYAACSESLTDAVHHLTWKTSAMILATCASAAILNWTGMRTVKELGASSTQVLGKLNTIIIVAFSVCFLGEQLQCNVLGGTCLILGGVALFESAERGLLHKALKCRSGAAANALP